MIRALRRVMALSNDDKRTVFRLATLVPTVELGLRLFGFRRVSRWVWQDVPVASEPPDNVSRTLARTASLSRAVNRRWFIFGRCLARSLALARVLQQAGIDVELRFGQRVEAGAFSAHAWLEHDGMPINEAQDIRDSYTAFEKPILGPIRRR